MDADYEDIGENGGNEYGDADLGLVADAGDDLGFWLLQDILTLYVRPWLGPCMVAPSNHHAHHVQRSYTVQSLYSGHIF